MGTVLFVAVAVVVVAALLYFVLGRRMSGGREGLKRRFGPEYHRAVARHEGDVAAAERELRERVKRHGSIQERPLAPGTRERYTAEWIEIQQRFVDAPRQALADAETLLGRLAKDRGYPDAQPVEEQIAAVSVHHGEHVHGYRSVRAAAHDRVDTEGMRRAMIEARGLFDALTADRPGGAERRRDRAPRALTRRHHVSGGMS
jgi:hypothetical protein